MIIFKNHNKISYFEQVANVINDRQQLNCTEPFAYEIDGYELTEFRSAADVKNHFGDMWQLWAENNDSLLLIEITREVTSGEPEKFFKYLIEFCHQYDIDSNRVIIMISNNYTIHEIRDYVMTQLPRTTVASINYLEWDAIYNYRHESDGITYPHRRFFMMSRTYKAWRHYFIGRLYIDGLLENSYYSFYNSQPYSSAGGLFHDRSYLIEMLSTINPDTIVPTFNDNLMRSDFYDKLPMRLQYESESRPSYLSRLSTSVIDSIYKSTDIDVVIETLFGSKNSAFHPTEKLWKSIINKKPFVLYSTMNFLKHLRDCGYKTFHPWINEDYDDIRDNHRRAEAIIAEIHRLNRMSDSEIAEIIKICHDICQFNYDRLSMRLDDFYYGCEVTPQVKEILNVKIDK